LRFIAALYVFLFHMQINWPLTQRPIWKGIIEQGAVGMSLFFMLSGFVLAYRYAKGGESAKDYFVNRFARIYPVYLFVALATLPFLGVTLSASTVSDAIVSIGKAVFLIVSNIFLIQAWFPQLFSYWNDGGSWSVSVETFCYLLLPLMLPWLVKRSAKQLLLALLVFYVVAIMPGISMKLFGSPEFSVFYAIPAFRLPEFLMGVCVFLVARVRSEKKQHPILSTLLVGAAAYLYFYYLAASGTQMPAYVGHNWATLPFIALLLYVMSNGKDILSRMMGNPVFVWLGKISYCFYSFQALVLKLIISHHDSLVSKFPALANPKILAVLAFSVLVAISAAGYYLIEEPARRYIRQQYKRKSLENYKQAVATSG